MSIIAWDGKHLVADNQCTHGSVPKKIKKIIKFTDKKIVHGAGFVGTASEGLAMIDWYRAGADPTLFPDYPDTELIVVTAKMCLSFSCCPTPLKIMEGYYATGSGCDFATSALSMGQTARQAVLHAIKYDVFCGMGTTTIKLK